jgi:prepilin-type processing-associated H-X9-DG protein
MKMTHPRRSRAGFTQLELWIVVAIVVILGAFVGTSLVSAQRKARRIRCISYQKQICLGSRIYATDHGEMFSQQVTTNKGGSLEYIGRGQSWRHFSAMSNELGNPIVLACLSDSRRAVNNWGQFGPSNLSYFISLDASEGNAQAILSGDRDIETETPPANGILVLVANKPARWTGKIHYGSGNYGLADGSVQQASAAVLQAQVDSNRDATNRIELP